MAHRSMSREREGSSTHKPETRLNQCMCRLQGGDRCETWREITVTKREGIEGLSLIHILLKLAHHLTTVWVWEAVVLSATTLHHFLVCFIWGKCLSLQSLTHQLLCGFVIPQLHSFHHTFKVLIGSLRGSLAFTTTWTSPAARALSARFSLLLSPRQWWLCASQHKVVFSALHPLQLFL